MNTSPKRIIGMLLFWIPVVAFFLAAGIRIQSQLASFSILGGTIMVLLGALMVINADD